MRYRFADLEFDLDQRRLSRDGNDLELSKLTFDVLSILVQAAPDLVTHDQLVDGAWGENRVVTPENLYQRITVLRKALGDDAQHPEYIESVRGTGFRLIPAVIRVDEEPESREIRPSKWTWAAIGVVALLMLVLGVHFTGRVNPTVETDNPELAQAGVRPQDQLQNQSQSQTKAIAVLPLENFSPDPDHAFYARGIHEELLNQLAKLRQLRVTSRTSVARYAGTNKSIRDIADELGVDAIIEGSVRYAEDRIRITVQLIDGATDQHLWSETYDHPIGDIFAIESDIASRVANALRVSFAEDERLRLERAPTASEAAYVDYLRGQDALAEIYFRSGTGFTRSAQPWDALPFALQQLERAVETDPEFALAHAALSQVHIDHYWYGIDRTDERRRQALVSAQRARELQPDLPEARLALAWYFYHGYLDYTAALQELDAVRERMPSNADLFEAYHAIYRRQGRWEEALEHGNRHLQLDPVNPHGLWNLAATNLAMRRYDEARRLIDKAIALAPDMRSLFLVAGGIELFDRANTQAALAIDDAAGETVGDWAERMEWWHAFYSRDYDSALEVLDRSDSLTFPNQPRSYQRESLRALIHRLQGNDEQARMHFELAREQIEARLEVEPIDWRTPNLYVMLGEALVALGDTERGLAYVERGLSDLSPSVDAYFGRFLQYEAIMRVYLITDPIGTALPLLDEYLSAHGGGFSIEGMLPDPRLDPIRDDPRFQALVEKHRRSAHLMN